MRIKHLRWKVVGWIGKSGRYKNFRLHCLIINCPIHNKKWVRNYIVCTTRLMCLVALDWINVMLCFSATGAPGRTISWWWIYLVFSVACLMALLLVVIIGVICKQSAWQHNSSYWTSCLCGSDKFLSLRIYWAPLYNDQAPIGDAEHNRLRAKQFLKVQTQWLYQRRRSANCLYAQ